MVDIPWWYIMWNIIKWIILWKYSIVGPVLEILFRVWSLSHHTSPPQPCLLFWLFIFVMWGKRSWPFYVGHTIWSPRWLLSLHVNKGNIMNTIFFFLIVNIKAFLRWWCSGKKSGQFLVWLVWGWDFNHWYVSLVIEPYKSNI